MEAEIQKRKDKETLERIKGDLQNITLLSEVLNAAIVGISNVKGELELSTRLKLNGLISLYFEALTRPVAKLMPKLQESFFVSSEYFYL